MSRIREHLSGSVGLLRAAEVASNWQAFVLLAGGGFIALVLVLIGTKLAPGSLVTALFCGFLALAAFLAGASATGIVLMDDAKDFEPRSLGNAALAGLLTLPRFLGLGILVGITFVLYMLVIALLFFVCKIPGLGRSSCETRKFAEFSLHKKAERDVGFGRRGGTMTVSNRSYETHDECYLEGPADAILESCARGLVSVSDRDGR